MRKGLMEVGKGLMGLDPHRTIGSAGRRRWYAIASIKLVGLLAGTAETGKGEGLVTGPSRICVAL